MTEGESQLSFDLMVFAPEAAPRERESFMKWYSEQVEWDEGHSYDDPVVSTPQLRGWFTEMIAQFPPMNGPCAVDDPDDPHVTDYSVGKNVIYAAFAWSQAEPALALMTQLAAKHGVGLFDLTDGTIYFPSDAGRLVALPGQTARSSSKPWWKFW